MARGDYLVKFGGSRSGYEKGKKDAQKDLLIKIGNVLFRLLSGSKKRSQDSELTHQILSLKL